MQRAPQAGTALVEVLIAIYVTGIGLLALLTLFPLGALEMAEAIQDDRTAAVAANARVVSQSGEELVSRTAAFVEASLFNGSVDPDAAAQLREAYERFALEVEDLQIQVEELQQAYPSEDIQRYLGPLLAQIRSTRLRISRLVQLLSILVR